MVGVHLPDLLLADLLVVVFVQPADQNLVLLAVEDMRFTYNLHVLVYEVDYLVGIEET